MTIGRKTLTQHCVVWVTFTHFQKSGLWIEKFLLERLLFFSSKPHADVQPLDLQVTLMRDGSKTELRRTLLFPRAIYVPTHENMLCEQLRCLLFSSEQTSHTFKKAAPVCTRVWSLGWWGDLHLFLSADVVILYLHIRKGLVVFPWWPEGSWEISGDCISMWCRREGKLVH